MGNDESVKIAGIGDVYLETEIGTRLVLKDVRRVQDIHLNLISTGRVDDEGFCSTLKNGQCKLTKGSLVVAKGKKYSTLYLLQAELSKHTVNVMKKDDAVELWHRRLGHMGEKGMTQLARRNILSGIDKVHLKNCVDCLEGKQSRVAFRSSLPSRVENVLDLIHSDLCGPMPKSLGGAQYLVTFIDDHSRRIWAYPLKTKDQVLDVFKHFHASVERQTGRKLKCIQTYNGGEYIGEFDAYCKKHGIRH